MTTTQDCWVGKRLDLGKKSRKQRIIFAPGNGQNQEYAKDSKPGKGGSIKAARARAST